MTTPENDRQMTMTKFEVPADHPHGEVIRYILRIRDLSTKALANAKTDMLDRAGDSHPELVAAAHAGAEGMIIGLTQCLDKDLARLLGLDVAPGDRVHLLSTDPLNEKDA